MSSVASSSRHHLRSHTRQPLIPIELTAFLPPVTSISLPSPISLPSKRGPSTFDTPSASGSGPCSPGGKARKVSRTEKDGSETVRKTRVSKDKGKGPASTTVDMGAESSGVTPRVKNVLERDDLGTGKSPARRLFAGPSTSQADKTISGISGAIATPPISPSGRKLAPSPPILDSPSSSRSSFFAGGVDVDVQSAPTPDLSMDIAADIHDCGFVIYEDMGSSSNLGVGSRTPESGRVTRSRSRSHTPSLDGIVVFAPSPSVSSSSSVLPDLDMDDQENVPPRYSAPYSPSKSQTPTHSARSTPSKNSTTGDDEIVSLYLSAGWHTPSSTSGSGTRRRERSKLANEVMLLRGEMVGDIKKGLEANMDVDVDMDGEEEELTPGRKEVSLDRARKRLVHEVDMA